MNTPQERRWPLRADIAAMQEEAIALTETYVAEALAEGRIKPDTANRMLAQVDPVRKAKRNALVAKRKRDREAWKAAQTAKLLGRSI